MKVGWAFPPRGVVATFLATKREAAVNGMLTVRVRAMWVGTVDFAGGSRTFAGGSGKSCGLIDFRIPRPFSTGFGTQKLSPSSHKNRRLIV